MDALFADGSLTGDGRRKGHRTLRGRQIADQRGTRMTGIPRSHACSRASVRRYSSRVIHLLAGLIAFTFNTLLPAILSITLIAGLQLDPMTEIREMGCVTAAKIDAADIPVVDTAFDDL
jgi:hypothetical protein